MVKKILSVFAIASMMLATSCSNDEFDSLQNGKESTVTFTAQLPDGLQTKTRAYGDGKTANTLTYAVYEVGDTWNLLPELGKEDETINKSKEVSLRLVNGNKYVVVFWADAPESIYTFDAKEMKVTARYDDKLESNEEAYDAFFAVEEITVDGSSLDRTVYLKRPFAQLNIGTADWEAAKAAGHEVTKAGIKVKTYNTLNFQKQDVEGEKDEVTFNLANLPGDEQEFPVEPTTYKYLTMNYLLMPKDKETDNTVTIIYDSAPDFEIKNVPMQRNFRTNIYGNLLTSPNDFNVEIKPDFNDPAYKVSVWDGTVQAPTVDANGVYHITNASEFADFVNNTSYASKYHSAQIVLECDIDMNGKTIKGVQDGSVWQGNFDGQAHTVSNFVVDSDGEYYAGLFPYTQGATVKNVTVKNATISGGKQVGAVVGGANGGTVENCRAINCTVTGVKKVGAVVGYTASSYVKDCYAENCTVISGNDEAAEVVGFINTVDSGQVDNTSGNTYNNVTVLKNATTVSTADELKTALNGSSNAVVLMNDITIEGAWTPANGKVNEINGNGHSISGLNAALLYDNYNLGSKDPITVKNLTIKDSNIAAGYNASGAIIAYINQQAGLTLENCHLVNSTVSYGNDKQTGGLVGMVTNMDMTIKGCSVKNSTINGGSSGAGIVGLATTSSKNMTIENCSVTGSTITSADNGSWRVGAMVGTANGNGTLTISGCTESNNTYTMKNSSSTNPEHNLYGRAVDATVDIKN